MNEVQLCVFSVFKPFLCYLVSSNIVLPNFLWHIVVIVFFVDVHFAVFPLGLNDYAASVSFERDFTLGSPSGLALVFRRICNPS